MPDPDPDALEAILRQCAAAAPEPWYPSAYAQTQGISRDSLDPSLDRLRLGGMIRLTDWVPGHGQGYALTPEGQRILESPRDLARLRAGKLVHRLAPAAALPDGPAQRGTEWDRGEAVREALLSPAPPRVTRVLLFANIAWFVIGLVYAAHTHVPAHEYLAGSSTPGELQVLQHMGALSGVAILQGAWWRLLSNCFVHIGLLHLGVNMYSLWVLGRVEESMWGHARYLILYLLAGLGGSCGMLLYTPEKLGAGASGALFGLMSGLAVWVVLSRRYIGQLASVWLRQLLIVFVLNIGISTIPGISAAAHFGGALAGLVAAVLLYEERFGAGVQRGLAVLGLAALPVVCIGLVLGSEKRKANWAPVKERFDFGDRLWPRVQEEEQAADQVFVDPKLAALLNQRLGVLSPEEVQELITALRTRREHLERAATLLREAGPYLSDDFEHARQDELQKLELAIRDSERDELRRSEALAADAARQARRTYGLAAPLLGRPPVGRDATKVEDMIVRLQKAGAELTRAVEVFQKAGPYPDEQFDKIRQTEQATLQAEAKLLDLAVRRLQQGSQWSKQEEEAFNQQLQRVRELDEHWPGRRRE